MKREPSYQYFEDIGTAAVTNYYKDKEFIGVAQCAPEDKEFVSMRTGLTLAQKRADVLVLTHIRDNEIKPALGALKQLYSNIEISTHFDAKSYEAKMLKRRIAQYEQELKEVSEEIKDIKKEITYYINAKDMLHKRFKDKTN